MASEEQKNDNFVFIDMQGFKTYGNKFIVKEFCLMQAKQNVIVHDIVKSPFDYHCLGGLYRSLAHYNTTKHHGLYFDIGNITKHKLIQSTLKHVDGKTIIVKGVEKVQWVRQLYENYHCDVHCENIEDWIRFNFRFKTSKEIAEICSFHKPIAGDVCCHCALSQAQELCAFFYKDPSSPHLFFC